VVIVATPHRIRWSEIAARRSGISSLKVRAFGRWRTTPGRWSCGRKVNMSPWRCDGTSAPSFALFPLDVMILLPFAVIVSLFAGMLLPFFFGATEGCCHYRLKMTRGKSAMNLTVLRRKSSVSVMQRGGWTVVGRRQSLHKHGWLTLPRECFPTISRAAGSGRTFRNERSRSVAILGRGLAFVQIGRHCYGECCNSQQSSPTPKPNRLPSPFSYREIF